METIEVGGVALELQRIDGPGNSKLAPIIFLHEGLGSVSMWRDWPQQVCQAAGRAGFVYRAPAGVQDGGCAGGGRSDLPARRSSGCGSLSACAFAPASICVLARSNSPSVIFP